MKERLLTLTLVLLITLGCKFGSGTAQSGAAEQSRDERSTAANASAENSMAEPEATPIPAAKQTAAPSDLITRASSHPSNIPPSKPLHRHLLTTV